MAKRVKIAARVLLVVALLGTTVVGLLAATVTLAFTQSHESLRDAGRLPPADLAGTLVARLSHPYGIASPTQCAAAQAVRELREDIRYGTHIHRCGPVICSAPVPTGAAAEVLDRAGLPTTPLPLTLAAEVAYRFVPRDVLIDLYAEGYLRRYDLRALAQEHLGTALEQASTDELLLLMARAETAGTCDSLANPDIVRLQPEPSCEDYIAERLAGLERDLARAGYLLHR